MKVAVIIILQMKVKLITVICNLSTDLNANLKTFFDLFRLAQNNIRFVVRSHSAPHDHTVEVLKNGKKMNDKCCCYVMVSGKVPNIRHTLNLVSHFFTGLKS